MLFYPDFKTKIPNFNGNKMVNTPSEVDAMIAELKSLMANKTLHTVFRGLPEAKYKLFTSLQREWMLKNLDVRGVAPTVLIRKMLDRIYNEPKGLEGHFKNLGVKTNDWLYLALLQHYGAPSPLLDFTHNWEPALYFMCLDMPIYPTKNVIEHYASLVTYNTVDVCTPKSLKLNVIAADIFQNKNPKPTTPDGLARFIRNDLAVEKIMSANQLVIVPSYNGALAVRKKNSDPVICYIPISNLNMVSQEGEFICNTHACNPLEDILKSPAGKPQLTCYNVHKSLREYIIYNYLGGDIEAMTQKLFPNERQIARTAHQVAISTLNCP